MSVAGKRISFCRRLGRVLALCALAAAGAMPGAGWTQAPTTRELRERLAAALLRQDAAAIDGAVAALNLDFGEKAGLPERRCARCVGETGVGAGPKRADAARPGTVGSFLEHVTLRAAR